MERCGSALGLTPATPAAAPEPAASAAEEIGEHVLEVAQDVADSGVVEVEPTST